MPLRFDTARLDSPRTLPNGWLRGDAHISRVGIFKYINKDGSVRRELRLPEHVFAQDSLDSFSLVPICNNHPPVELTAENTKQYQVGSLSDVVKPDGDFLKASMLVTDAATVQAVKAGKTEISCGYRCDLDFTQGVWQGEPYDAVQLNIRGNHVAFVDKGRAGPEARMRMDSADDAAMVLENTMDVEISIGGKKYMVPADVAAQMAKLLPSGVPAMSANDKVPVVPPPTPEKPLSQNMNTDSEVVRLRAERDTAVAKLDALSSDAARKDAADKAHKIMDTLRADVRAEIKTRADLENKSLRFLGKEYKFDGVGDIELRKAVILKVCPKFDFAGKSDVYIESRFDAEVERYDSGAEALARPREAQGAASVNTDSGEFDEDKSREKMRKDSLESGNKPLTIGRSKRK